MNVNSWRFNNNSIMKINVLMFLYLNWFACECIMQSIYEVHVWILNLYFYCCVFNFQMYVVFFKFFLLWVKKFKLWSLDFAMWMPWPQLGSTKYIAFCQFLFKSSKNPNDLSLLKKSYLDFDWCLLLRQTWMEIMSNWN